jgi:protein-S-isoprenylcysteine O-methyltransferase Ste14
MRGWFLHAAHAWFVLLCPFSPALGSTRNTRIVLSWECRCAVVNSLVLYVIQRDQIEREEQYLEGIFGEEYLTYKTSVRRWV